MGEQAQQAVETQRSNGTPGNQAQPQMAVPMHAFLEEGHRTNTLKEAGVEADPAAGPAPTAGGVAGPSVRRRRLPEPAACRIEAPQAAELPEPRSNEPTESAGRRERRGSARSSPRGRVGAPGTAGRDPECFLTQQQTCGVTNQQRKGRHSTPP